MVKGWTKNSGSPLWFWTGVLTLALVIFVSSASIASFMERYSAFSEWPICGMVVVDMPLILFGIYCVRKGRGDMYSLKADLLPILLIALLVGLLRFSLGERPELPLLTSLLISLFRGVVTVFVLAFLPVYFLHRRALRKMGIINVPRDERSRKTLELQCSRNEAFNLCKSALNSIGAAILEVDETSGFIAARTGPSMKSWGEVVTFNIQEAANKVEIEVMSKPRTRLQLFDYGKNYQNVKKLAEILESKTS